MRFTFRTQPQAGNESKEEQSFPQLGQWLDCFISVYVYEKNVVWNVSPVDKVFAECFRHLCERLTWDERKWRACFYSDVFLLALKDVPK